jgi:imidazole glycerol-phosphate synthase subunit HisH
MITIIDYNLGNVGSIYNMLTKIGEQCIVSSDSDVILKSDKLILPGVGSFDNGISNLRNKRLIEPLNEFVKVKKKPILGICLGMQLMAASSHEGKESGLLWIPLEVVGFKEQRAYNGTIPVMGWNYVSPKEKNPLLNTEENRYYFVHSFFFETNKYEILTASVNNFNYCAAFQNDNVFGVQFHPEKSHKYGMELLQNFCKL